MTGCIVRAHRSPPCERLRLAAFGGRFRHCQVLSLSSLPLLTARDPVPGPCRKIGLASFLFFLFFFFFLFSSKSWTSIAPMMFVCTAGQRAGKAVQQVPLWKAGRAVRWRTHNRVFGNDFLKKAICVGANAASEG